MHDLSREVGGSCDGNQILIPSGSSVMAVGSISSRNGDAPGMYTRWGTKDSGWPGRVDDVGCGGEFRCWDRRVSSATFVYRCTISRVLHNMWSTHCCSSISRAAEINSEGDVLWLCDDPELQSLVSTCANSALRLSRVTPNRYLARRTSDEGKVTNWGGVLQMG